MLEFNGISLENLGTSDFDEIWLTSPSLHLVFRKNKFQANMGQEFEFPSKVEFGSIYQ
jgi:hypothetical protein